MPDMWQRFTNPATRVIHFAQEEAKIQGCNVVDTAHILAGLIREDEGVAARVLQRLGITLDSVREIANRDIGSQGEMHGRLTLSPKAKKALEYSLQEARELNPRLGLLDFVDTEHILLGLIHNTHEEPNRAREILDELRIGAALLHQEVLNFMGAPPVSTEEVPMRERKGVDVWLSLSEPAFRILTLAGEEANRHGTNVIDVPHLAAGLLRFNEAALARQGVYLDQVRTSLFDTPTAPGAAAPSLSPQCADVLGLAYQAALKKTPAGVLARISPAHLAQGLLDGAGVLGYDTVRKLADLGVDLAQFKAEL